MKNILLISLLTLFIGGNAIASESPAARNCRIHGGQPWTLDIGQADDLQLCILGSAQISAQSLFEVMTMDVMNGAVEAYTSGIDNCREAGGEARWRYDSSGMAFKVCQFYDGSAIASTTLAGGRYAPQNRLLSQLLGL